MAISDPRLSTSSPSRVSVAALWALLFGGWAAASCAPGEPAPDTSVLVSESDWHRLEKERRELLDRRNQVSATVDEGREDAAGAEPKRDLERRADEFSRHLVAFLNADPPRENEPLTARQAQAIRWKSEEDILLARDYVQRAGDFRRAIDILEAALALDPGYEALREELVLVRAARFVTAERFNQVKPGMGPDDVRGLLGAPNPHNVREYLEHGPGRGVIGWFYPKDDHGSAAGVWFSRETGSPKVYRVDFAAIQPDGEPRPAAPLATPEAPPS